MTIKYLIDDISRILPYDSPKYIKIYINVKTVFLFFTWLREKKYRNHSQKNIFIRCITEALINNMLRDSTGV